MDSVASVSIVAGAFKRVAISGSDRAEAAFLEPPVAVDTLLTFSLIVTDSPGGSTTDFISVMVRLR